MTEASGDTTTAFTDTDALLEAMVVMMLIDRDIDDAEIDRLRDGLWRGASLTLDDAAIQAAIDRASVARLTQGLRALRASLQKDQRQAILSAAIRVAGADGAMLDAEYDMAVLLGEALGFDEMEMRAIWQDLT